MNSGRVRHASNVREHWRTPFLELFQLDPASFSSFNKQTHFWAIQCSKNPGSQFKATLTSVLFGLDQASLFSFVPPPFIFSLSSCHTNNLQPFQSALQWFNNGMTPSCFLCTHNCKGLEMLSNRNVLWKPRLV